MPSLRRAEAGDAAAIAHLLRTSIEVLCTADHQGDPAHLSEWLANKTPEEVSSWIADARNQIFVAVDGHGVAGVGAIRDASMIMLNYVSPRARFSGISSALMAALEAVAREAGSAQVRLESTITAREFYQARGYRLLVGADAGCGSRCLAMGKDIAAAPQISGRNSSSTVR